MASVKKPKITLDSLLFVTPEQKVLRLLLGEPTTSFTLRTIASKLKGVRGVGGVEGLTRILQDLESLGMVDFLDNRRLVRLHEDICAIKVLKKLITLCDLEGLRGLLEPLSNRGILYGSRAIGDSRSDSSYNLFVVSQEPEEARRVASSHPLGRFIDLVAWTPQAYQTIHKTDPQLHKSLTTGIVLWGSAW